MRFSLPTLSAPEVLIAENPEIGAESSDNIYASATEVQVLGTIKTDALGGITWIPRPGAAYGAGLDVHVVNVTPILGTLAPVITLNATVVTAGSTTLVTTFGKPSYVPDQNQVYGEGCGFDMIPQGSGNSARLVTAIAGVATLTNVPINSEFVVLGSPLSANFVDIGWGKSVDGAYNSSSTISLARGYNPTGATKKGVGEVKELTMDFNHVSSQAGMCAYNGMRTSVLVKILADNTVHKSNILYYGYRGISNPKRGVGNDEVVETCAGPFEGCAVFNAL